MHRPYLSRVLFPIAAMLAFTPTDVCMAQQPMKSREIRHPGGVAVIDMQRLLKEFRPFVQRLEELHDGKDEANLQIVALEKELDKLRESKNPFVEGSPPYKKIVEATFDKVAEIAAAKRKLRYRFEAAVAALYVAYFRLVTTEISYFAKQNEIHLVLNRAAIRSEAGDAESAQALFGQKVVYERKIDITNDILDRLDAGPPDKLPKFAWEAEQSE